MNLLNMDWDKIESLITEALDQRIRTYDYFEYLIIDTQTLLVKVYNDGQLSFTIKFRFANDKLEVVDAW